MQSIIFNALSILRLYTVGHSSQSLEEFLTLLQRHGINCVVDVRSVPASKYAPQFNEESIKAFLKLHGIQYLPFGNEFGARRTDCINDEGQVDFEVAVTTPLFQQGVKRLMKGLERGFCIALMCSEADPLECHRFSLVSRYFHNQGIEVLHILKDAKSDKKVIQGENVEKSADALSKLMNADSIILVASYGKTGMKKLLDAKRTVHPAGDKLLGVIMTGVRYI